MDKITSKQVIAWYFMELEALDGMGWINQIANYFPSDSAIETYPWIGVSPTMREWIGGRHAKGLKENFLTIRNKLYEATLEILVSDMRRDKTGQILARIQEFAGRGKTHWAKLLSDLLLLADSTPCYDGQFFFDTDHTEGKSGTQSNSLTIDISELPTAVSGSITAPSVEEMQWSIMQAIAAIAGFKDEEGEPMNEMAQKFLVMTPMSLWMPALNAVATPAQVAASQSAMEGLKQQNVSIEVVPNVRLADWTSSFSVFRADGKIKPLIRQEEYDVALAVLAEGSEHEFKHKAHQYGIDSSRAVGLGRWQGACKVTMA